MKEPLGAPDAFREPEKTSVTITKLTPDDWEVLRDLKLRSLEQEPIAFEDPEEGKEKYLQRSEEEWREILSGHMSGGRPGESHMVFAQKPASKEYVGMVTAIIPAEQSGENKIATVQHMFVDNAGRGHGTGKALLQSLLDELRARGDIQRIELEVVATQTPAIRLYKSVGFSEYGRKVGAVHRDDRTYDEIEMALDL